jgi:EAL domain-containing protein (putative c-di-GMP-specific phosphodiesterase class I)
LSLSRNLGRGCIAEGVETRQQLEYLQKQVCPEMQGFLYSPAVPAAECGALVRAGNPAFAGALDDRRDKRELSKVAGAGSV